MGKRSPWERSEDVMEKPKVGEMHASPDMTQVMSSRVTALSISPRLRQRRSCISLSPAHSHSHNVHHRAEEAKPQRAKQTSSRSAPGCGPLFKLVILARRCCKSSLWEISPDCFTFVSLGGLPTPACRPPRPSVLASQARHSTSRDHKRYPTKNKSPQCTTQHPTYIYTHTHIRT